MHATLHEERPGETLELWFDGEGAGREPGHGSTDLVRKVPGATSDQDVQPVKAVRGEAGRCRRLVSEPAGARIVVCLDEKFQIQALDRSRASLSIAGQGGDDDPRLQAQRHDHPVRRADVLSVLGECLPRHRHIDFLKFLRIIDCEVPRGLQIHLILDNYATHEHPNVKKWLAKHPRFHPTSHRARARGRT